MQNEKKEHWMSLCEQAAAEQNPERLLELIAEINRMLDEKDKRLQAGTKAGKRDGDITQEYA
jgi:hypothetical protein